MVKLLHNMKNIIVIASLCLSILHCATPTILKENVKSKTKNLAIEVVKVASGPDSFASGGKNFFPKDRSHRLIHITLNVTNLTKTDYSFIFTKIALEPPFEVLLDEKGKEVRKLNPPAFVRFYEVGFSNDIKEDVSGNNFANGKVEKEVVIKPNETITRTLMYALPTTVEPEQLVFLDEKSHIISFK
ncbi:hypothetical protein [Leptospira sp. GIMC2001]|uniref:hypothetical protein n=1 Tax=Leptospira sp. GIMC2001 TaxID=1513297 RepID=UPI00234B4533|nr:hypothetical protein [Leptospira sp. GIMC2001]WCL51118.1 hypothetical protein O4O04_09985 [Leptospira sp. GIMC2001]